MGGSAWSKPALVVFVAIAMLGGGCSGSPVSPTDTVAFSQLDLRLGTGAEAVTGAVLTVDYTGWFYDESKPAQKGVPFNSSAGQDPFTFTLGVGSVIGGWDQGLVGMKVGGLRRLVIPPSLAYGALRSGPIPPNSTLVFEVELLAVQTSTAAGSGTLAVRGQP